MEALHSELKPAVNPLLNLRRHTKVLLILFAMILVAMVLLLNMPQEPKSCELIEGAKIRTADMQRMQVALASAGFNDFEVKGDSLLVPVPQRNTYLKAISEAGALPVDIEVAKENKPANLFLSRDQQEEIKRNEKKQQVRDMITRLPFVEQAWFETDRLVSSSAFKADYQTAVVQIQPVGRQILDREQINTIRGMIAGAIAGLSQQSIVVTDLNAGITHQESAQGTHPKISQASVEIRDKQVRLENRIRDVLADMGEITVKVTLEKPKTTVAQLPQELTTIKPTPPAKLVSTIGINSTATIEAPPTVTLPQKHYVSLPPVAPRKPNLKVQVEFPERIVIDSLTAKPGQTLAELRKHPRYSNEVQTIKSEVERRVRQLEPVKQYTNSANFPVHVQMVRLNEEEFAVQVVPWWQKVVNRLGGPVPTLGVLGASLLIIAFIFSGTSRKPVEESTTLVTDDLEVNAESRVLAKNSEEQSVREEISQLIKEDPEAAAQVIKRWIRDAA